MDNPVFVFISKACDIVFLSFIWILFCIPVITIGPANTALYYATVKVIRRERGYVFREFFKSFKINFKRGAIIGLIMSVVYAILGFDLLISKASLNSSQTINTVLYGLYLAIAFLVLSITVYIFPLLSRFDMNIKQLIKSSVFMSLRHLPFTILMIAVLVAAILGIITIPTLILFLPAIVTLINSLFMERILKKYTPQSDDAEEDASKDKWYME
jgi:uncharacterized membrane protein YesL